MVYDVDVNTNGQILARDLSNQIYWYNADSSKFDRVSGQPSTVWYLSVDDETGRAIVLDAWFKAWV